MKPMPPVTTRRAMTSSLHLDVPIVWDVLRIVGDAELVRLFVVVQLRREVHEVHRFRSDRLETVDDVRRDLGIRRRYIFVPLERVLALSSMRTTWRASSMWEGGGSSDSPSAKRRFGAGTT